MATFTRKNAWNNNGTFDNSDLLWYAKGVEEMQSRSLADPNSWWFFAAIHGQYVTTDTNSGNPPPSTFPNWSKIPPLPKVPITPLPSADLKSKYWDQCQHQTWYFAPWHRGYLIALEAQVRAAIVSLGGPKDWALPYWDYFGLNGQDKIPPAFSVQTLPDGSSNPLFVKARYGNKVIVNGLNPATQKCQTNTIYTGSNPSTPSPGYGGLNTGFSNAGNVSGNLESNPHNEVHVDVGGINGLMSDPGTAALDPIFYLHHCNIDRLWASWNDDGNSNPTNASWLAGPAANGEREFVMPLPGAKPWVYTPADMNSLSQMDYDYQQLLKTAPGNLLALRLSKLGVDSTSIKTITTEAQNMDLGANSELVGANKGTLQLKTAGVRTTVYFESSAWKKVPMSLMEASVSKIPDRVYLQLENVKGNIDGNFLTVSVNQKNVGRISLFGLRKASMKEGHHGGSGITFLLDITDTIDSLHMANVLNADSLDIAILPNNEIPEEENITIGRVSVYREGR